MPQLTLEFSSNILEKTMLPELLKQCHIILSGCLPTTIESCKSRAIERNIYCVGDGQAKNAFVHLGVKILPGRSVEVKTEAANKIMEILKKHFAQSINTLNTQITLELADLPETYFKFSS
jgi:5-carboxymethyl-2-hydroxymuconate isomerase